MSQYTSLHVVSANDVQWMPDNSLVKDIVSYMGCNRAWVLSGYSKPMYWDAMEGFHDSELFIYSDVSIEEAMRVWQQMSPTFTYIGLTCEDWSEKLSESTGSIPESLSEGLTLYETSVTFGPFSIPSLDYEATIGRYCFQIKLGGSGMPCDPIGYFEIIRKDPMITELLSFLNKISRKEWSVLMSCSY